MKKEWFYMLIGLAVISSCKNSPIEKGEACSLKVSGIEFTKSLNNAKALLSLDA